MARSPTPQCHSILRFPENDFSNILSIFHLHQRPWLPGLGHCPHGHAQEPSLVSLPLLPQTLRWLFQAIYFEGPAPTPARDGSRPVSTGDQPRSIQLQAQVSPKPLQLGLNRTTPAGTTPARFE